MTENKELPTCPDCDKDDEVVRYGKSVVNDKKRFACKRCGTTFYRPEDYVRDYPRGEKNE